MRHLAITGMETADMISRIFLGDAMRATPPSARICAGTRSSAMTETAPAFSAISAWWASVTSMMTPPLSISARPVLRRSEVLVLPLFCDMVNSEALSALRLSASAKPFDLMIGVGFRRYFILQGEGTVEKPRMYFHRGGTERRLS